MSYTKVNVRKDIIEQVKIKAAADNRSITNYIETLLLADIAGNDLQLSDPDVDAQGSSKAPNLAPQNTNSKERQSNE